jgi:hypothetical protein
MEYFVLSGFSVGDGRPGFKGEVGNLLHFATRIYLRNVRELAVRLQAGSLTKVQQRSTLLLRIFSCNVQALAVRIQTHLLTRSQRGSAMPRHF